MKSLAETTKKDLQASKDSEDKLRSDLLSLQKQHLEKVHALESDALGKYHQLLGNQSSGFVTTFFTTNSTP